MGGKIHHTQGRGHGKGHPAVVALLIALVVAGIMRLTNGFGLILAFSTCTPPQPIPGGSGTESSCSGPGLIYTLVVIPSVFGLIAYVLLTRVRETSPGREIGARRNRMLGGRR